MITLEQAGNIATRPSRTRDTTGRIMGAGGVSGHLSEVDEDCAVHAITACGLRPDPGE
jgi:hypothetical protein